uniref:Uncharacterized protein n=1 Tax=Anguilla anguilla TaxID=7936 RepID=A0A0E9XU46_ANGAN
MREVMLSPLTARSNEPLFLMNLYLTFHLPWILMKAFAMERLTPVSGTSPTAVVGSPREVIFIPVMLYLTLPMRDTFTFPDMSGNLMDFSLLCRIAIPICLPYSSPFCVSLTLTPGLTL